MNKQLTPMQELKQIVLNNKSKAFSNKLLLEHIEQLLPKEKQVIEDSYWDGVQDIRLTEKNCSNYYNNKFKKD